MLITKAWIHAHTTAGGAWNRKQIEALGLDWPARKGWISDLVGTDINSHRQRVFEKSAKHKSIQDPAGREFDRRLKRLSDRISELERLVLPPI